MEQPLGRAGGLCLLTQSLGASAGRQYNPRPSARKWPSSRPVTAPGGQCRPHRSPRGSPFSGPAQSSESVHPSTPPSRGFQRWRRRLSETRLVLIRLHRRSDGALTNPRRPRQEEGTPVDRRRAQLTAVSSFGDCRACRLRSPVVRRPAEAAAIFPLLPPAERAKLLELCGGRRRRQRSRRSRSEAVAWRAKGSGLSPTSRVMLGPAVRGAEATRTSRS